MRCIILLGFLVVIIISTVYARDLMVGTSLNNRLLWQQKAEYMGIPFKKRVKEVFYTNPAMQAIKGVIARDLDHTEEGTAIITAGGVGSSFVNIRLKSVRGSGLNYDIEIYG